MRKPDARPVRSLLYTPGDQEDRIAENVKSGADALFIDIEEPRTPCPEATRVKARGLVREFLDTAPVGAGAPIYFVRVQPVASGMILRDLQAVLHPNVTAVMLPKITGPADVHAADAILRCVEVELGIDVGSTLLYPILENASAIRNAYDIAMASDRVAYMGGAVSRFGDICADIGFRWTRRGTETLFIREKVLIDARAAGIRYPISGMWGGANDDLEGLTRMADRAARHRLLRDDDGQQGARADRQRRVHAHVRRGRLLAGARPPDSGSRGRRRTRHLRRGEPG